MSALGGILGKKACSRCYFGVKEGADTVCRRMPPQVSIVMLPAPPPNIGRMMPTPLVCFPSVRPDQWCGEFKNSALGRVDAPASSIVAEAEGNA